MIRIDHLVYSDYVKNPVLKDVLLDDSSDGYQISRSGDQVYSNGDVANEDNLVPQIAAGFVTS